MNREVRAHEKQRIRQRTPAWRSRAPEREASRARGVMILEAKAEIRLGTQNNGETREYGHTDMR